MTTRAHVPSTVLIDGRPTSVALEPDFLCALRNLARASGMSLSRYVSRIDRIGNSTLSSTLRVHVLRSLADASFLNGSGQDERRIVRDGETK